MRMDVYCLENRIDPFDEWAGSLWILHTGDADRVLFESYPDVEARRYLLKSGLATDFVLRCREYAVSESCSKLDHAHGTAVRARHQAWHAPQRYPSSSP